MSAAPLPLKPSRAPQGPAIEGGGSSPQRAKRLLRGRGSGPARDYASKVASPAALTADEAPARRLWELQDAAQRLTPRPFVYNDAGNRQLSPIRKCRRVRVGHTVAVRVVEDRAHFEGLATCRSVWECPCCSRTVRAERAETVRRVVQRWEASGGASYLATFTFRHGWSDRLGETAEKLAQAWQHVQRSSTWRKWTKAHGVQSIRALEVTHGENGWHPHLHVVFLTAAPVDESAVATWLHDRWSRAVRSEMGEAFEPSRKHGTDFRKLVVEDYIVKIGAELTDAGGAKAAKNGNRTPWQLLESAAAGDPSDTWLWREYAAGMVGRRFLTWSRGLKEWRAQADEELEAEREEERASSSVVLELNNIQWDAHRDLPDFRCEVLLAATQGPQAVLEVLQEYAEIRRMQARAGPSEDARAQDGEEKGVSKWN